MASNTEPSGGKSEKEVRREKRIRWVALLAAIGVTLVAFWLLWYVSHREPVAAPFTRVGGATNVETAVDASRFWLTPPRFVVETSATASPQTMLAAAQCAMVHDAPLLFSGTNSEQKALIKETISGWPKPFMFTSQDDLTSCVQGGRLADLNNFSTLAVAHPVVQLPKTRPRILTQPTLAPVVVFVAPLAQAFLPDVAVGMALGAHMATLKNPVSLVVVPRYLEADPELEKQLEGQHGLVSGGVVLGQIITVPDDTRALLRQLLTSTDRHNWFAQVQAVLTSVGPVTAALLALIGVGAAGIAGKNLITERPTGREGRTRRKRRAKRERRESKITTPGSSATAEQSITIRQRVRRFIMSVFSPNRPTGRQATSAGAYWRTALDKNQEKDQEVTVWLRSGTRVAGKVSEWYPSKVEGNGQTGVLINEVLQLTAATITKDGVQHPEGGHYEFVLLSVEDIELISKAAPDKGNVGTK